MNNWITLKLHSWIDDGSDSFSLYELLLLPLQKERFGPVKLTPMAMYQNVFSPSSTMRELPEYVVAQQLGGHGTKFLPIECEWKWCVHSMLEPLKQQTSLLHPFFSPFCPTRNDSHPDSNTYAARMPRKRPELSSQPGQLLAWMELNYLPKEKNEPSHFGVSLLQQLNIPLMNTIR